MTIQQSRQRLKEATEAYKTALPGRDLTEVRAELTIARSGYEVDCVELVSRLAEALEPIAKESVLWHKSTGDEDVICTARNAYDLPDSMDDSPMTVGDLRALAALYEEVKQ
jgi:hypothetical protein